MNENLKQLSLPISWAFSKKRKDFVVSDCNRYAFEWLEKWPFKIKDNFVCMVGEKGSGKTHLSGIWAERLNADIINASDDVFNKWYSIVSSENTQKYFVLDDADLIKDDIVLFYIYNTIKEKNAYLLMTAARSPNKWDLKFKDIKSRLSILNIIRIQRPNEAAINSIIEKMLLQRGILVKENVVDYISNRIERSYESINYWINKLDSLLIDKKSGLSIKIVKEIIK